MITPLAYITLLDFQVGDAGSLGIDFHISLHASV